VSPRVRRACAAALAVAALWSAPGDALSSGADPSASSTSAERARTDACGPLVGKPGGGHWRCTFVDNFSGTALDTSKWAVQDTVESGFRSGLTCYRGGENVEVSDGTLRLTARDLGRPVDCSNPYGQFLTRYTGGLVTTRNSFTQIYGRFEVRAKFPTARTPGVHGAFWMYPPQLRYGQWPASGEIDVAEWWSSDPQTVLPTLHYNGRNFHADSGWGCQVADVSSYHTYRVEWYRTGMRFFVDNALCFSRKWRPEPPQEFPQPFDHPFGMILNMGVGTAAGSNRVTEETELPATFVVDYARAWK